MIGGLNGSSLIAQDQAEEPVETVIKKDAPPADAKKNDQDPSVDKEQSDAPAKPKPKPSLTDRLLDDLIGQAKEQAANPLDAIVERMRAAQQRLQKTETDQETRELQAQVVKDLDELIEKLKNQKPPPKSSPNQPPPPMGENDQNMPPRGGEQPKPQNSQKQPRGGAEPKPQQSSASKSADKSRQSTNQSPQQQPRSPEEEAARQRMAKDVWGHLPPALRQQLLNVYSEKFLPKYDEQVRKYYEALAEQNRKNP